MITRARRHMTVVSSLRSPDGIIGDYLRYAEHAPVSSTSDGLMPGGRSAAPEGWTDTPEGWTDTPEGWAGALAAELRRAGLTVRSGYPVGRWRVDLCVGTGADAVGLICGVHPDGVDSHVERQRTLLRAGWRLHDAFASRWSADPVRAALELTHHLR